MTRTYVLKFLCLYNILNPDCVLDKEDLEEYHKENQNHPKCYCDNCFTGRTELAEELLKYLN
jgi:hypothetical protein